MPQLSSTDRLIMAGNDMSNELQNTHPEVPFAHIGDDTIEALAKLAKILKTNFKKFKLLDFQTQPAKAAENNIPAKLPHPLLTFPV
jgi:predicted RNase H-like nuclease